MNAKHLIAAAAMLVSAAGAFAAETPAPAAGSSATGSSTGSTVSTVSTGSARTTASSLNLPALDAPSHGAREETKAEAVDFVKNYRTLLSIQLDQYKN